MDANKQFKVKTSELKILWSMVFMVLFILSGFVHGLVLIAIGKIGAKTGIYFFAVFLLGAIGIGPGAHRLFSHHSYKVTRGLKIFIIFCQQVSGLKSVISWVRVHRTHHKFVETDRDPTNINRGIFYACIGCGLTSFPPDCAVEMERIHLDDLFADKDVVFQYRHYFMLYLTITLALPTLIPYFLWSESIYIAFIMNQFRLAFNLFQQFIGNGLLHYNGQRSYDKNMTAIDNVFYNVIMLGEGYHNFHHAFPFDYRANELSEFAHITSMTTFFIDVAAFLGLAWDRKVAPPQMIANRIARTGDGSHKLWRKMKTNKNLWGYGDADMSATDKKLIDINANLNGKL